MQELEDYIRRKSKVLSDRVIKVNTFLNHQVDPALIVKLGDDIAHRFRAESITKVLTLEASGIHIAFAAALALGVPFVYAKKSKAITQTDVYHTSVYSFTRQQTYSITLSQELLTNRDKVLIVDDILAEGASVRGLMEIIQQAGASLAGVSVAIEKSFQDGRKGLDDLGVPVYSLARISNMSPDDGIEFIPEL